jgi:hypothetical protein
VAASIFTHRAPVVPETVRGTTFTEPIAEPGVFQMLSEAESSSFCILARASIGDMARRLIPIEKTKSDAMNLQVILFFF